jgi:hypothetical protein
VQIPSDSNISHLATSYAKLVDSLDEGVSEPLLVLPNNEFFPDKFRADEASVAALVARMQGYAGLEEVDVDVRVIGELEEGTSGGCGTGACHVSPVKQGESSPRIVQSGSGFVLQVPAQELRHSIVLTSRLASSLGAIYLFERHAEGQKLAQDPALAEMMAVELGFGVLLLEASYLYAKSCGGPSIQQATMLSAPELALSFAFFVTRHGHTPKKALAELGTTQRALVKEALSLVAESPALERGLKQDLARVARGRFKLREGRSFLARWFGSSRSRTEESREIEALAALERGASVDELAYLLGDAAPKRAERSATSDDDAELRAAVDEALVEMRGGAARERA